MRKPTERQRRLWAYRRRKALRRLKEYPRDGGTATRPAVLPLPVAVRSDRAPVHIELPSVLSIRRNRGPTLQVYTAIRHAIQKRRRLKIDFTTVHDVTPAAALVLASELDRWRRLRAMRPEVLDLDRWDPKILKLFADMGLFDLVEAQNQPAFYAGGNNAERFIRFRTGSGALGEEAIALREAVEGVLGEELQGRRALYRGVTEAMTNVHKHAYIGPFSDKTPIIKDAWWIGGGFEFESRHLRVLVFDQGVGIPATLPRRYAHEAIADVLRGRGWHENDSGRIAAAMELGRTRTGRPNQGRGLPDLRQFVDKSGAATLRILSRRGEYLYDGSSSERLMEHKDALGGTLIQWEVDLRSLPMEHLWTHE